MRVHCKNKKGQKLIKLKYITRKTKNKQKIHYINKTKYYKLKLKKN